VGKVLFEEAFCEDKFAETNLLSSPKMEPLDSEEFDARQRFEARTNAYQIKSNILKLVRMFQKKPLQDKLIKEFSFSKTNEITAFSETFNDCRSLW
jgi:hypothetical protein